MSNMVKISTIINTMNSFKEVLCLKPMKAVDKKKLLNISKLSDIEIKQYLSIRNEKINEFCEKDAEGNSILDKNRNNKFIKSQHALFEAEMLTVDVEVDLSDLLFDESFFDKYDDLSAMDILNLSWLMKKQSGDDND